MYKLKFHKRQEDGELIGFAVSLVMVIPEGDGYPEEERIIFRTAVKGKKDESIEDYISILKQEVTNELYRMIEVVEKTN